MSKESSFKILSNFVREFEELNDPIANGVAAVMASFVSKVAKILTTEIEMNETIQTNEALMIFSRSIEACKQELEQATTIVKTKMD